MNTKWTKEEELQLIKNVCQGVSLDDIATSHKRSTSAIELRLKKIIYENVICGLSLSKIASTLCMDEEKIRQYFYSYKEFREKHGLTTHNNIPIKESKENKTDITNSNQVMIGGMKELNRQSSKIGSELDKLELENRALKLILENKILTSKVNKLIKSGNLDKNIKKIIKNIRNLK